MPPAIGFSGALPDKGRAQACGLEADPFFEYDVAGLRAGPGSGSLGRRR